MTTREFINKILWEVNDLDKPIVFTYQETNAIGEEVKFINYHELTKSESSTNIEFIRYNSGCTPTDIEEVRAKQ